MRGFGFIKVTIAGGGYGPLNYIRKIKTENYLERFNEHGMNMDWHDAAYEEGMDILYKEFKQQYHEEFFGERVDSFYAENPDLLEVPLKNLQSAKLLLRDEYKEASLLHAAISIEVGIKTIISKPIFYAFTSDNKAAELLWSFTWRKGTVFPAHRILLADNGIYIVENLNLEELAQVLAERSSYEFALVLNPPRIRGGTGAAINAFAIIPQ